VIRVGGVGQKWKERVGEEPGHLEGESRRGSQGLILRGQVRGRAFRRETRCRSIEGDSGRKNMPWHFQSADLIRLGAKKSLYAWYGGTS